MVDPMPTFDGTEPANLKAINNGNASAADAIHQQMLDQIHADDYCDTIEDLPDTGNWLGRRIYVVDDQQLYVCTALPATWVREDQLGWTEIEPTKGPGWGSTSLNTLERRGGYAYLEFNAFRGGTDLAVDGVLVEIPSGYRGTKRCWAAAWHVDVPSSFYQVYYNPATHRVETRQTIPAGEPVAVAMMWPITTL